MRSKANSKGYTLLFAIIVSTVVLSVAAFILTISRKQFLLASASRDSTVAFYAADSGIECAMEASYNGNLTPATAGQQIQLATAVSCGSATPIKPNYISASPPSGISNYNTSLPLSQATIPFPFGSTCAVLTVTDGTDSNGSHMTVIDSNGYNVNCTGSPLAPTPGPRDENRWIRVIEHS